MNRIRKFAAAEEGSTLILTIFYTALCLLVVLIVVAATSLYLERKRLFTLADGAALAGAEAFAIDALFEGDQRAGVHLHDGDVAVAAAGFHAAAPSSGSLDNIQLQRAVTTDGQSATITLSAWWKPPILTLLIPAGMRLEVEATARSVLLH